MTKFDYKSCAIWMSDYRKLLFCSVGHILKFACSYFVYHVVENPNESKQLHHEIFSLKFWAFDLQSLREVMSLYS